jgi:hypothetical protein
MLNYIQEIIVEFFAKENKKIHGKKMVFVSAANNDDWCRKQVWGFDANYSVRHV